MDSIIPVFSCKKADETLAFYGALGFKETYRQDEPYLYAAIQYGDVNIHFTKGSASKLNPSHVLIHVADVRVLHRAFADGLRALYGRVPTADFPRITRLRPGHTRFSVFDPNGNILLFINRDEPDYDYSSYEQPESKLKKALDNAVFLRDTYTDDRSAAKMLDKVLSRTTETRTADYARVVATRAEIAVALGDTQRWIVLRRILNEVPLDADTREAYHEELNAPFALERWITHADAADE